MTKTLPLLFLFIMILAHSFAQEKDEYHDFGFVRDFSLVVRDETGTDLAQPWIGGLNACQFSEIDLNLDGIKDLFVFDRHGHRILPFVNHGTPGKVDYTYAPEYISRFPNMREWVNLVDYNCDGKKDIFTYTTGGIRVFKNVSDTSLEFKLEVPLIYSYYYSGYVNLFALIDDFPVIDDIDGDGDKDILNFFTLGKYLNYHKNLSMEKWGHCDSLDFRLKEECWGYFEENESSNVLTLDITCGEKCSIIPSGKRRERHAGSSLLAIDLDGDEDRDLLLGDIDFPTIAGLINGGTRDSAHMISQDTLFPSNTNSIDLISMPLPCYVDVNYNGVKDLLVSPSDPGLERCKMGESVWRYNNTGTNDTPHFEFQQENFLQDQMIDLGGGAYPVIYDVDQDGLDDLIIGNWGQLDSTYYLFGFLYLVYHSQIAFYHNIGATNNPVYKLIDLDFGNLSEVEILGACPSFADLDGDQDADMLVGNMEGNIFYLENLAGPGNIPHFSNPQPYYQSIDVGDYSTPQLIDLDRDALVDLVIGEMEGNLNYYRNDGTSANPEFIFVTDSLGKVNVTDENVSLFGFSVPCMFDHSGEYQLFVGSESGYIYYYSNIDDNLDGSFTLKEDKLLYIKEGIRTGVAVYNFNGDQYVDMIIGNYGGGVSLFRGVTPPPLGLQEPVVVEPVKLFVYPNPVRNVLTIGRSELAIGNWQLAGKLSVYNVIGTKIYDFEISNSNKSINIDVTGFSSGVYFVVLSEDGKGVAREKFVVVR